MVESDADPSDVGPDAQVGQFGISAQTLPMTGDGLCTVAIDGGARPVTRTRASAHILSARQ